ncbi:hypothetical protein [Angelakisella massiliensis]|uniref:hypothetical protein n=1 Tax=Angelakisella massiliensis TaxID=1871018 RepID=UPI0008F8AD0C|nr:hypothetical protein [Angelakisella massiliensis]
MADFRHWHDSNLLFSEKIPAPFLILHFKKGAVFIYPQKFIIRPRAITKYYYRMRRKAHTIGRSNWTSSKGRHISAKELYSIYSRNDEKQTFIDYAKKAKGILKLNDQEADALIKNHKRKIAMAIKEGQKK